MIVFNKPPRLGNEENFVLKAMKQSKISGDGNFSCKCQEWFQNNIGSKISLLTTSCTHALEMAALLINIKEGDEIIMPSYTFVSTANAFALRGATIIFIDIRPDTMNIDENKIEEAITSKTKAIVPVHYAGVACEMDTIMTIANKYNLVVIEDAAQAMMSTYKGKTLGTIGHIGTYSFHETKNYTSGGEGGLILINDEKYVDHAEIIREKGTNRNQFFRGMVNKYTWVKLGSSYLPSELQAAYLYPQLLDAHKINNERLSIWNYYYQALKPLEDKLLLELPYIPNECEHNAHMFYIKTKNLQERTNLINYLKRNGILTVFHYVPLHSSEAGQTFGKFDNQDIFTTIESERILRVPLYYGLTKKEQKKVIENVFKFYQ